MNNSHTNISENQKNVLNIILESIKSKGFPPSIREIQKKSGIKSLRGVVIQLEALEQAGLIKRKSGARAIQVIQSLLDDSDKKISIPLMACTIHAGDESEVDNFSDSEVSVSLLETKGLKNVFAVKVCGDSMIGEDINDGDLAILYPQPVADNGDIVAARTQNGMTLKKYRVVEGIPMLFPANSKYNPIVRDFEIQGKLVNIIKK